MKNRRHAGSQSGSCLPDVTQLEKLVSQPPKAIGGYFDLELNAGEEYHTGALRLNTARNAFEYILRARKYKRVYLPYYTCGVMLQPIEKLGLEYRFYHIDSDFEPCFDYSIIGEDEGFLYTNYYGLKDRSVEVLAQTCRNLVVDNAQAFFSRPVPGVDVFYSPRKFFGLPDGAYLYTDVSNDSVLEQAHSDQRFSHLLLRMEYGPEVGYNDFVKNDSSLDRLPIAGMSNLTQKLLKNIDYVGASRKRRENYMILHEALGSMNMLALTLTDTSVPMTYPFYSGLRGIRQHLIENRIYVARYWPNVLEWTDPDDLEWVYADQIAPLPIDQRYSSADMRRIIATVHGFCG